MTLHGKKRKTKAEINEISFDDMIKFDEMIKSLDKLRWDHPITLKAFKIARELNTWIGKIVTEDEMPFVSIVVSAPYVAITIGDYCVWNSESDSEDDLTFDYCKESLHEEVLRLCAVFEI